MNAPWLPPLAPFIGPSTSGFVVRGGIANSAPADQAPSRTVEAHPEMSGSGCASAVNAPPPGMAVQRQFPAARITVSGETSGGGCAAVANVSPGGSPQQQLAGCGRDVFPGLGGTLPPMAGPPAGEQQGQLLSRTSITATIR